MRVISKPNQSVMSILKTVKKAESGSRLTVYCVQVQVDEGFLLYNLLTKELVLLTEEEYTHLTENKYLNDHWFVIPEGLNEKECADLVKWVLTNRRKTDNAITGYTIFTTTDCNARCFYCYEMGRSRIPMSLETAQKVVQYIKAHCGGKKIKISWFGGEPLYNVSVIDAICEGLHSEGIEFASSCVSNGYLFDKETVQRAVENWHLQNVQISLDGTETAYNRIKAYIYQNTNPYQRVLQNIGFLLNASVKVSIRLNMDLHNADNLLNLVDELSTQFAGSKHLRVYAHYLFEGNEQMADLHTEKEWNLREEAMNRLNYRIVQSGFSSRLGIEKTPKLNHCMADHGNAITILPTGDIGLCEHFSENEFIGHIDSEGFDQEQISSWKETAPELPECAECFYYPSCIKLHKCPNTGVCFKQLRNNHLGKVKQSMLYEYQRSTADAADPQE